MPKIPAAKVAGILFNNKKSMKYIFTKTIPDDKATSGTRTEEIEATPERWVWGVVYKDGTELKQFGDDGIFHQFGEINQKEVQMFVMYRLDNPDKRIDLIPNGKQIFHFYRNVVLAMLTEDERRIRVYCFGFKDQETGNANYHYILQDDRVVIANEDIDITKFNI